MMKKLVSTLLVLAFMLSIFAVAPAGATSAGDWDYTVKGDGTAKITQYRGSDADVTVPAEVNGIDVTEIGEGAFGNVRNTLISLTVSEGIQVIDGLRECQKLKSVSLPESLTEIKPYAFLGCWRLTEITLPHGLKTISNFAFQDCSALKSVVIPEEVTAVGFGVFYNCSSLESVTLNQKLTYLADNLFYNCVSLKQIFVPASVERFGSHSLGYYDTNSGSRRTNDIIIKTPRGSAAQVYAKNNGLTYVNTDIDYYIEPASPIESPLNIQLGDIVIPVERGEIYDFVYYTVNPQPVCSIQGTVVFPQTRSNFYGCEILHASEEDGGLMAGSYEHDDYYNSVYFEVAGDSADAERYSEFLLENGLYLQPIVRIRANLTESHGTYSVYCYCAGKVRDINGKLLFDGEHDYQDQSFVYGVMLLKDGEDLTPPDETPTEPAGSEPEYLRGDANGDGEINNRDAMILDRYVAGWAGYEERIADMDALDLSGDGQVNNRDAMILDRYVAGWQGYDKYFDGSTGPEKPTEPTEPEKPTVPTITKVESGNSGVIIKWDAFEGAELYRVFYKTGANSWKSLGDTASTSFTHADAPYDTECRYTVRCIDKNGNFTSDYDKTGYLNTRLKNPTLKSATLMNYFIGVSWDKVSGAKAYRVYIKGGQYTSWTWIYDCDTNYIDVDAGLLELESNTKYSFTVRCLDDLKGDRLVSGYDTKGVSVKYYESPFIYGLVCTGDGIEIYWDEVEGVSKYRVFEWRDGGWKKLTDLENTAILVTGLSSGSLYRFTIRGLDSKGDFITPYDSYGRMVRWYSSPKETTYNVKTITESIEREARSLGFCADSEAEIDPDEIHYFMLDSTAFYYDADDINEPIQKKSYNVIGELAKKIERNGEPVSNYCFSIEAEADEYDEIWFYIVYMRRADAD